jgi:hypothetical protein
MTAADLLLAALVLGVVLIAVAVDLVALLAWMIRRR